MIRTSILLLILGSGDSVLSNSPPLKWPLRAMVTDLHGRPVEFQALTLGGDLIVEVAQRSMPGHIGQTLPEVRALARGDTLRVKTPASFPLDLRKGPVVFFTSSRDSIRVVVGRNPSGAVDPVIAAGRHLTARLENGSIVINAR